MKEDRRKAKLTQRMIEAARGTKGVRIIISDTDIKGFRILVGETSKTFILEKRITGVKKSAKKYKIGTYPVLSLEKARETAKRWSHLCECGKDPSRVEIQEDGEQLTIATKKKTTPTVEECLDLHSKYKKPGAITMGTYQSSFRVHFKDWLHLPLSELKITEILERGHKITKAVSPSRAVGALSNLRAVWTTAKAYCDERGIECPGNPLLLIKLKKLFAHEHGKVVVPITRLGQFIDLMETMVTDSDLGYGIRRTILLFQLCLFLGMRNGEARRLKWEYIDLETGYFKLPGHIVKNKKAHLKPICNYAKQILLKLHQERRDVRNPYVFPAVLKRMNYMSRNEKAGHLLMERMGGNFEFNTHALRRTFISLADEINTPRKVLKNLVNHISGDVTDGYCVKGFNPKKETPYLNKIEEALLILRDKYRRNEPLPELATDLFPKKEDQKIAAMAKEIEQLKAALALAQQLPN